MGQAKNSKMCIRDRCIHSVIFYIASSNMILDTSSRDMRYTIKAIDSILDYDGDLMSQMQHLEAFTDMDSSRILSLIHI